MGADPSACCEPRQCRRMSRTRVVVGVGASGVVSVRAAGSNRVLPQTTVVDVGIGPCTKQHPPRCNGLQLQRVALRALSHSVRSHQRRHRSARGQPLHCRRNAEDDMRRVRRQTAALACVPAQHSRPPQTAVWSWAVVAAPKGLPRVQVRARVLRVCLATPLLTEPLPAGALVCAYGVVGRWIGGPNVGGRDTPGPGPG